MDSRLERRIKWWKEQLRKKHKQKRADFDSGRKTKSPEKLVDETTGETNDVTPEVTPVKKDDRKRKRKEQIVETSSEDPSFNQPKKKKRDTTDSSTMSTESVENSTDSTVKKKYILFVGNVPFSATAEDITAHFQRAGIKVVDFRLLTKKSGSSKGCGFMQLKSSKQLQAGLKLHHTNFDGRKINVELSCGGGGKTDKRKEKIMAKNRRLQKQRIKKRKKASKTDLTDQIVTSE